MKLFTLVGRFRAVLTIIAAGVAALGWASAQITGSPAAAAAGPEPYRLGPNDQIEVMIYGQTDNPLTLRVTERGTVTLPSIGQVDASGKSALELAEEVETKLKRGGYLVNPIVNIEVTAYESQTVTVLGAVAQPGIKPLRGQQRLSRLIALAGGVEPGNDIVYLKREGQAVRRIQLSEIALAGGSDPILQPGDVIQVPEANRFYVYGQVRSPGSYAMSPGMTFRQALALGGGANDAGTQRGIKLYRDGETVRVDDLDDPIMPDDVIYVRERLF